MPWRSMQFGRNTPPKGRAVSVQALEVIETAVLAGFMAFALDIEDHHGVAVVKGAENIAYVRNNFSRISTLAFFEQFQGDKFDHLEPPLEWRFFEVNTLLDVYSYVSTQALMATFFGPSADRPADGESVQTAIGTGAMSICMRCACTHAAWS